MSTKKEKERLLARDLRRQLFTVREISKKLLVSIGSISIWVRDIEFSDVELSKKLSAEKLRRISTAKIAVKERHAREALTRSEIVRNPNTDYSTLTMSLKRQTLLYQQKNCCAMCGLSQWLGVPIVLEIDHINGDRKNNDRSNHRLVCPNCHSTTDTYKSKNSIGRAITDADIVSALLKSKSIYKAIESLKMNPHGNTYIRFRRIAKDNDIVL